MKKLITLSIILISLVSCIDSNEDDIKKDPIIGTWYLFSKGGTEVDDCTKKSTYTFEENNDFFAKSFTTVFDNCSNEGEAKAKWSSNKKGVYTVTPIGATEGKTVNIEFLDNNSAIKIVEDDFIWKKK